MVVMRRWWKTFLQQRARSDLSEANWNKIPLDELPPLQCNGLPSTDSCSQLHCILLLCISITFLALHEPNKTLLFCFVLGSSQGEVTKHEMNLIWSVAVPHVEHSSGRGMHFISWIWGKSRQRVRILWNDSSKASRTRISLWMKQFRWPMNDQWIIARVDKRLNCQETWVVLSGTGVDRFVVKTLNWAS